MKFAWHCRSLDETHLIEAKDWDEAYEKVIAIRMEGGYDRKDCEAWFEKNDQLMELTEPKEEEKDVIRRILKMTGSLSEDANRFLTTELWNRFDVLEDEEQDIIDRYSD